MWVHTQMNRSCVIAIRTSYNAHNRTSALMNICLMVFPDERLKKDRNTYFLSALQVLYMYNALFLFRLDLR